MKPVIVYSSRNNDNGKQPDNKMFWNVYAQENEDFSSQLDLMIRAHKQLYQEIVAPEFKETKKIRIDEHPAFKKLEQILKSIYEKNGCVILEMFLYSAKAIPDFLPNDNSERPKPNRDVSNTYARLLARLMDRSIRETPGKKKGDTSDNPSISGYVHVLKDWPKTGTWNEIQRLAIRVYSEMRAISEEVEDELFCALEKVYNYRSAFDALISAEKRVHSKERLLKILRFLCKKRSEQNGIQCEEGMYEEFEKVINMLCEEDNILYCELRDAYQEYKHSGPHVKYMNNIFGVTAKDPLEDLSDKSKEEKIKFIFNNYDPISFMWRRWLENLDSELFYNAVREKFEQVIYPSGDIYRISFMLCGFAGMRKLEQGRDYVRSLNQNPIFSPQPEHPAFLCVLLCARQLAGDAIGMGAILEIYEQLETEDVQKIQSTIRLLICRGKNLEVTQKRVQEYVKRAEYGNEKDVVNLLNCLCKYYQFQVDHKISQKIIPIDHVIHIMEERCGLNKENSTFQCTPSSTLLLICLNYIDGDITWENRNLYKNFLLAARQTVIRNRAEKLLVIFFSEDFD